MVGLLGGFQEIRLAPRFGIAIVCASALACGGGSSGNPNNPSQTGGGGSTASCRTGAASSHSVQTFPTTGKTTTTDSTCSFNTATNEFVCQLVYADSDLGPGSGTQTSRFAARGDVIDEIAVNPPLSRALGTTIVTNSSGFVVTITSTNTFDAQKRLTGINVNTTTPVGSVPPVTTTFTAWDSSGRPTAGTQSSTGGTFSVAITYDNANRTVRQSIGPNTCTQTYDANANIIGESCTGTQPSTTVVTINSTQQICR